MRRHLSLGLLTVLLALAALPARGGSAQAVPPGRSDFGVNSHIAARHPDPGSYHLPLDLLSGASAGWAREDFLWYRLEPQPGRYDWATYDTAIAQLASRGANIIGVLGYPPSWATPFGGDQPGEVSYYAPDAAAYARFAAAVVGRYRDRVRHWQIWNEPENALYWRPRPDAAAYAALLNAAYPAIKGADPAAQVLSGGVVPTNIGFIKAVADAGGWGSFDILAVHPYVDPYGPEDGQIGAGDVAAVRALAERLGAKPIWATEFGWSSGPASRDPSGVDEETQASYLVRGSALLRAAGVEKVIWYKLKDTELRDGRPFNMYGLVRFGGGYTDYTQQKPALAAFGTLNRQLAGAAPVGPIELGQRQVVMDFESQSFGTWRRGNEPNGTFFQSGAGPRSGIAAGALAYTFPGAGNDYVVFSPRPAIPLPGSPSRLGVWVAGDGSGHALKVWLRDRDGETLQFRLGFVGPFAYQFLSAPIGGAVEPWNRISGGGNLQLDFPASIVAVVLDDEPDSSSGSGTIYLDDITAIGGAEAYGVRFARGGESVDVLWAPRPTQVSMATASAQAALVDRWGNARSVAAADGTIALDVGPSPVFLTHVAPGGAPAPQPAQPAQVPPTPAPPPPATPTPAPQPAQPAQPCRFFAETDFQVCGRLLEYWEQNGGLPVFGYPIGPQQPLALEGSVVEAQWFERNRLELHPENARPYDVLLGRLGAERLEASGRSWYGFPRSDPAAAYFFPQTGQAIAPEFQGFWAARGLEFDGAPGTSFAESLALFGLPLSPAQAETNPTDGRQYLTQHFERARFEYHPENAGTPYVVLLGLLGRESTGVR